VVLDFSDNVGLDRRITRFAAGRHGVITLAELTSLGASRGHIDHRVRAGWLRREHNGVYLVGAPTDRGRWLAAVLACGPGAVLSHRSAAALWGIRASTSRIVEVTVPATSGRRAGARDGILLHRSSTLSLEAQTLRDGIRVTTPARTLADLKRVLPPREWRDALQEAEVRRLPLGEHARVADGTRSDLERRFLALCRRHRLPAPEVNQRIGRYLVDFVWRAQRLIVETDGARTHATLAAFETDREQTAALTAQGWRVERFTYRQITERPDTVAAALQALLA
jgi:very-short-patch-repair endonuclease